MSRPPTLNAKTVQEVLGPRPAARGLKLARLAIMEALQTLLYEIDSGDIGSRPLLVGGRPLGDWISLDVLAEVLRRAPDEDEDEDAQ